MNMNKRKILLVISVFLVVFIIIGLSYAYFQVEIKKFNMKEEIIDTNINNANIVELKGDGKVLSLTLTAEQMLPQNTVTAYYAHSDYSNNETETIGTISTNDDNHYYSCTYKLKFVHQTNGENRDMYDTFSSSEYSENRTTGQLFLIVGDLQKGLEEKDFYYGLPDSFNRTIEIEPGVEEYIYAGFKIVNYPYINQTYLAGTSLTINVELDDFKCNVSAIKYVAQSGDDLEHIAEKYKIYYRTTDINTIVSKIREMNNLTVNSVIHPTQTLKLPPAGF